MFEIILAYKEYRRVEHENEQKDIYRYAERVPKRGDPDAVFAMAVVVFAQVMDMVSAFLRFPARDVMLNTPLHVLQDFGGLLLVSLEDGLYYLPADSVSRNYIQYNYNPGGSGGSSGGEWTDPVL